MLPGLCGKPPIYICLIPLSTRGYVVDAYYFRLTLFRFWLLTKDIQTDFAANL